MWWNSSKDAKQLSLTIKGFFTGGVITAIVLVMGLLGIDIEASDINSLLDSFEGVLVGFAGLVSAVMVFYGVARKIYFKIIK